MKVNIILFLLAILTILNLSCKSLYYYEIHGGNFKLMENLVSDYQSNIDDLEIIIQANPYYNGSCSIYLRIKNKGYNKLTYALNQLKLLHNNSQFTIKSIKANGKYIKLNHDHTISKDEELKLLIMADKEGLIERPQEVELYIGVFNVPIEDTIIVVDTLYLRNPKYYKDITPGT